jgi:hypothetical protein
MFEFLGIINLMQPTTFESTELKGKW